MMGEISTITPWEGEIGGKNKTQLENFLLEVLFSYNY